MTSLRQLFRLYGIAALFSSVRKLHEDNVELKTRTALAEQQASERVSAIEKRADSERERILLTRGVPTNTSAPAIASAQPKRKASRIAHRIEKTKRREAAYYQMAAPSDPLSSVLENERQFDADSLLKKAQAITSTSR